MPLRPSATADSPCCAQLCARGRGGARASSRRRRASSPQPHVRGGRTSRGARGSRSRACQRRCGDRRHRACVARRPTGSNGARPIGGTRATSRRSDSDPSQSGARGGGNAGKHGGLRIDLVRSWAKVAGTLGNERTENGRRERGEVPTTYPLEVGLEGAKVMVIVLHAGLAESTLRSEVMEESSRPPFERNAGPPGAPPARESGDGEPEHLLDWIAHCAAPSAAPLSWCPRSRASRSSAQRRHRCGPEDLYASHHAHARTLRTEPARELGEDVASRVALVGQRRDVLLDGYPVDDARMRSTVAGRTK